MDSAQIPKESSIYRTTPAEKAVAEAAQKRVLQKRLADIQQLEREKMEIDALIKSLVGNYGNMTKRFGGVGESVVRQVAAEQSQGITATAAKEGTKAGLSTSMRTKSMDVMSKENSKLVREVYELRRTTSGTPIKEVVKRVQSAAQQQQQQQIMPKQFAIEFRGLEPTIVSNPAQKTQQVAPSTMFANGSVEASTKATAVSRTLAPIVEEATISKSDKTVSGRLNFEKEFFRQDSTYRYGKRMDRLRLLSGDDYMGMM